MDVRLATLTLSVAVGEVQVATAVELAPDGVSEMLAGRLAMTGGTLSMTVTVKLAVVVLPTASRAVKVTVVVPTGKLEP